MGTRGYYQRPAPEAANLGIDSDSEKVLDGMKEEVDALRGDAIDHAISTVGTRSSLMLLILELEKDINSPEKKPEQKFMEILDRLLKEIDDIESGITKRGVGSSGEMTMENAKTKLKQYREQIKKKKRAKRREMRKGGNVQIFDSDIAHLKKIEGDLDHVKRAVSEGQRGEYSDQGAYLYNSPENAKKSNRQQEKSLQFGQKVKEELKDGAIFNIFNQQEQQAIDFYRRISEGRYLWADYELYIANTDILNQSFQRCGIPTPTWPKPGTSTESSQLGSAATDQLGSIVTAQLGSTEIVQGTVRRSADYSNIDWGEAFKQGGLSGIIDKALSNCKNLTPGQRNTWKSIAVVGGYMAGIFGLYKFITSKTERRKKAGITGAVILGSQMVTGEGPISLFNKLMSGGLSWEELKDRFGNTFGDAFGDAADGIQSAGIESGNELSGAMYSLMVFNETVKVSDVRVMATKFKNNPGEWKQFRGDAMRKLNRYGQTVIERFSAVFTDDFDENRWNEWLKSIGIHDGIDDNKLVYELASNITMNTVIINKFLSDNGVKVTSEKKEEFEQYKKSKNDNNQLIDVGFLKTKIGIKEDKNARFIVDNEATFTDRKEDNENREILGNKVDNLPLDEQEKIELKEAMILFYDKRTIESKPNPNDLDLDINSDGNLVLRSNRGHEGIIDLTTKEIIGHAGEEGFGPGIRFTSLADLLDTVDLANKILEKQKNETPVSLPAFEYKVSRKGICFNDATALSFNFDTRVLSTGPGGATSKIDTLCNHPDVYAKYLSERRLQEHRVDVDENEYPFVKKLSDTGIDFIDINEVQELETWLNKVKTEWGDFYATLDGSPYKFSGGLGDQKLIFVAINGEEMVVSENISSKFPTIWENKEKFLKFMNDSQNGMYKL